MFQVSKWGLHVDMKLAKYLDVKLQNTDNHLTRFTTSPGKLNKPQYLNYIDNNIRFAKRRHSRWIGDSDQLASVSLWLMLANVSWKPRT